MIYRPKSNDVTAATQKIEQTKYFHAKYFCYLKPCGIQINKLKNLRDMTLIIEDYRRKTRIRSQESAF